MTTDRPASKPRPMSTWLMAVKTEAPRPPPPTMPEMTTMDSASMITWLTPAMIVGSASGSCTLSRVLRGAVPKASAASTSSSSTCRMPSSVMRTPGGREKTMVAMMPGTWPTPKKKMPGIR